MTFDELEVGKEYMRLMGDNEGRVRIIGKAVREVVYEWLTGPDAERGAPFDVGLASWPYGDWRPYTPPPEPVVRYVFARRMSGMATPCAGIFQVEANAETDIYRVGPVIRVELPICPDMLARVRDGAK